LFTRVAIWVFQNSIHKQFHKQIQWYIKRKLYTVLNSLTNFKQSPPLSSYYNLPKEYNLRLKIEPVSAIHFLTRKDKWQLNQYENQLNYKIIMDKQLVASKTMIMQLTIGLVTNSYSNKYRRTRRGEMWWSGLEFGILHKTSSKSNH